MEHKNETLLELFNRRKKDKENSTRPLPKRIEQRSIPVSELKKDLKDIINFTTKLINGDFKNYKGKGIEPVSFNYSFYYFDDETEEEMEADDFKSGEDFAIYKYDLWDYPGNPREIINDSPTGMHPIDEVIEKINEKVREYVNSKYNNKYDIEICGDWDDGPVCIVII